MGNGPTSKPKHFNCSDRDLYELKELNKCVLTKSNGTLRRSLCVSHFFRQLCRMPRLW